MTDKLKVGLLDLLTLLLPGGLLIFILLKAGAVTDFIPSKFQLLAGNTDAWPKVVLFVAASYVTGHFIYLLAANLDGWVYENVRKVFWNDHRLAAYILERKKAMTGIDDRTILNGFKWSCAWLLQHQPALYAEVERVMAESKFFRSLVVVCFISAILLGCYGIAGLAILMFIMCLLSLFRYLTQRQKSIDTAYIYMITALSEKLPFPENPDREKVFELRSRSLTSLAATGKSLPYEIRKNKRNRASFTGYCRKVFEVIKLCTWPWYIADIAPEGKPAARGHELRWFMQKDPEKFRAWLLQKSGNTCKDEPRTDVYYIKHGMDEMSIKDRGKAGGFEIKRKLPFDEKYQLAREIEVRIEAWYKWNIAPADTAQFSTVLTVGKYKKCLVAKKRWRTGIPGTDWQAEYTVVNLEDQSTWYSIALELPYNIKPADAIASLISSGIVCELEVADAKMMSYPAFLQEQALA